MLTVYKASAGSGKTFTLAYEYIKTLLGVREDNGAYHLNYDKYSPSGHRIPNRHRGILAITFTNAATEEMKSRIIRELAKLADDANPDVSLYAAWLIRDFGCTGAEICEAASQALAELLFDYGEFNVQTIDSFFQMVLRTFSREVERQGDYELSLDVHTTVIQTISLLLDDLNYAPKQSRRLLEWVQKFTIENLSSGKSYNLFARDGYLLASLAKNITRSLDETFGEYDSRLIEYLSDSRRLGRFSAALEAKAASGMEKPTEAFADFLRDIEAAGIPDKVFETNTMKALRRLTDNNEPAKAAASTPVQAQASGERGPEKLLAITAFKKSKLSEGAITPYLERLSQICVMTVEAVAETNFYNEIRKSLGQLEFFGLWQSKMREYLRSTNTVLISDTGQLLKRIINNDEVPFIYERLGTKLTNLLIDEFQDTSGVQWHNLEPLVKNSLSQGFDNLIIGDEKQAIYRFRNSDSELLGHVVQDNLSQYCRLRGFAQEDNTNHRSAGTVVRANNTIFKHMALLAGAAGYGNVVQTPEKSDVPGYVRISFSTSTEDRHEAGNTVLEHMAQDILRQHNEGGYAWRDILILARRRQETNEIVSYLLENYPEIRVLSSESLLLSSSASVRTIMNMLKLVESSYSGVSANDENPDRVTRRSDVEMMMTRFYYFRARGLDPSEAIRMALENDRDEVETIDKDIMAIRAENPANLVALVEAVILHKIPEEQRRREYAYIAALQDLVVKHAESADPSLASFISQYNTNVDVWAIKASSDLDAVQVMTIHKSKGLERDCVHIPFCSWGLDSADQQLWLPLTGLEGFDKEIVPPVIRVKVTRNSALWNYRRSPFTALFEKNAFLDRMDSLNLTYVAFSRAARELIVHAVPEKAGDFLLSAICGPLQPDEVSDSNLADLAPAFDKESSTLVLGSPTSKIVKAGKDDSIIVDAGAYPVEFRDDARQLTSIDDVLSQHLDIGGEEDKEITDRAPAFLSPEFIAATERGNVLHAVLSRVRILDDLAPAVERECKRRGVDEATAKVYLADLRQAFDKAGPLVAGWFDPVCRVFSERSIYRAEDDEAFRPDRVVISPDGSVTVVDYKFTSEPRPTHFAQVENYISLMHSLGRTSVAGYLWYPLLNKVIRVSE